MKPLEKLLNVPDHEPIKTNPDILVKKFPELDLFDYISSIYITQSKN